MLWEAKFLFPQIQYEFTNITVHVVVTRPYFWKELGALEVKRTKRKHISAECKVNKNLEKLHGCAKGGRGGNLSRWYMHTIWCVDRKSSLLSSKVWKSKRMTLVRKPWFVELIVIMSGWAWRNCRKGPSVRVFIILVLRWVYCFCALVGSLTLPKTWLEILFSKSNTTTVIIRHWTSLCLVL